MAGMPARRLVGGVVMLRPLLAVTREQTRDCCADLGLKAWNDPHNTDPSYTRARLRAALPLLVETLGPGVIGNLARTADLVAADLEVLEAATAEAYSGCALDRDLAVAALLGLPAALRRRVLHRWALGLGVRGSGLAFGHVAAMEALVVAWRGQGPVSLPGGVRIARSADRLTALR